MKSLKLRPYEPSEDGEFLIKVEGAGCRGILKTELRRHYETWCQNDGERAKSAQQFNKACQSRGLIEAHHGSGKERKRYWFEQKRTERTEKPDFQKPSIHTREANIEEISNDLFSVQPVHFSEVAADPDAREVFTV
jgi:hypothetical protein